MRIEVTTPSRLHFTLIDLNGKMGRVDGGIGVALENPHFTITASASENFAVTGYDAPVIHALVDKFIRAFPVKQNLSINITERIPQHVGLGSETQLRLGLATALAALLRISTSPRHLAQIMGRGGTSGIGIAAFENGGFIFDGGHSSRGSEGKKSFLPSHASNAPPPPILMRHDLPGDWRFIVSTPNVPTRIWGVREVELFQKHCPISASQTEKLCRIIFAKVLPSVVEADIDTFGEGLTEIQTLGFKHIEVETQQYMVKEVMTSLQREGAAGVGLSSFGPSVYAVTRGVKKAEALLKCCKALLAKTGGDVFISKPKNTPAIVRQLPEP